MNLTLDQAKLIKILRLEFGCTYSRIREILIEVYGTYYEQFTGVDICYHASKLLSVPLIDEPFY